MDKQNKYQDLVARVKASYPEYDPLYTGKAPRLFWCNDCKEINLWTYWQGRGNLNAKIMLVGQDWGCPWDSNYRSTIEQVRKANNSEQYQYLYNNPSPTDANMAQLFLEIDESYDISKPCPDLFFTNFILGYRSQGFSGKYDPEWARHDIGFFQELAGIIEPEIILCLGKATFLSVLSAFHGKPPVRISSYNDFIESPHNPIAVTLGNGKKAYVFALAHCGAMGTLNRNRKKSTSLDIQKEDWRKIAPYLHSSQ